MEGWRNPGKWSVAMLAIQVELATWGLSRRSATMAAMNGRAKPGRVAMIRSTSRWSRCSRPSPGHIRTDAGCCGGGLRALAVGDPAGPMQGGDVPDGLGPRGRHAVGQHQRPRGQPGTQLGLDLRVAEVLVAVGLADLAGVLVLGRQPGGVLLHT